MKALGNKVSELVIAPIYSSLPSDMQNKIFGFQFHPDSFLTKNGKILIQKILSA